MTVRSGAVSHRIGPVNGWSVLIVFNSDSWCWDVYDDTGDGPGDLIEEKFLTYSEALDFSRSYIQDTAKKHGARINGLDEASLIDEALRLFSNWCESQNVSIHICEKTSLDKTVGYWAYPETLEHGTFIESMGTDVYSTREEALSVLIENILGEINNDE